LSAARAGHQERDFPPHIQSRFPMVANAGSVPAGILFAAVNRRDMAFGMPAATLSSQGGDRKCRKHGQLDILVFGMPKIYSKFFC
jgi:hypothetical protein